MSDTTQLSDQYLLHSTLKPDHSVSVSRAKHVVEVPDINAGSYQSGLITVGDSTTLNGSKGFASLADSYLQIPYVVTARNTSNSAGSLGGVMNRFACALKCGVWNLISDLELELDGKSILTSNEYKSFWNNLRHMTETSQSDLQKSASEKMFYPDDWFSINFSESEGTEGDGYSNNRCSFDASFDYTLGQNNENRPFNSGVAGRLSQAPLVADELTNKAFSWASLGKGGIKQIISQTARSCFIEKAAAAQNADAGIWIYNLSIRLGDLHPIFKELKLVANPSLKMKYRVNCGTTRIEVGRLTETAGSTTSTSMRLLGTTMTSGYVCPIMVSSGALGQPMGGVGPATGAREISFSFGVLQNQFTTKDVVSAYVPYNTTQLQVPFYDITDPRSIISSPVKTIKFLDAYAQYFADRCGSGITDGQQNAPFNFQLSANLKNIKYVALMPFANTKGVGHYKNKIDNTAGDAAGIEQFQSPFDSAPYTLLPGASIKNFQVRLGNRNVFSKTVDYDYESFIHEFSKLGAVNGDQTSEMSSGIVDFNQWSFAQRVLVADCSRLSEKDVPMSVQVSGVNNCSQAMNILVLVVYERELELDLLTGKVESMTI